MLAVSPTKRIANMIQHAPLWMRFTAYVIDTVLIMGLQLCAEFFLGIFTDESLLDSIGIKPDTITFFDYVFYIILPYMITMRFWYSKNASCGQLLFGMHMVNASDDQKPSIQQFIIRYMSFEFYFNHLSIMFFDSVLGSAFYLVLLLGFIVTLLRDENKMGWHDHLSHTRVVRTEKTVPETYGYALV